MREQNMTNAKTKTKISPERDHFLLIKRSGFLSNHSAVSATEGAKALLKAGVWPLWRNTKCKNMVRSGHRVLIYLAGPESDCGNVIASAVISGVVDWEDRKHRRGYPLMIDGEPLKALLLEKVSVFDKPVSVSDRLDHLSFIPENKKKWGVAMMGGMRSLTDSDFMVLCGTNIPQQPAVA